MAKHAPLRERFEREQRRKARLPNLFKKVWNVCVVVFWVFIIMAVHLFIWQWFYGLVK